MACWLRDSRRSYKNPPKGNYPGAGRLLTKAVIPAQAGMQLEDRPCMNRGRARRGGRGAGRPAGCVPDLRELQSSKLGIHKALKPA